MSSACPEPEWLVITRTVSDREVATEPTGTCLWRVLAITSHPGSPPTNYVGQQWLELFLLSCDIACKTERHRSCASCARGVPYILYITVHGPGQPLERFPLSPPPEHKKTPARGRGSKWCIALGIEVWGLPVMRSDTPAQSTCEVSIPFAG